MVAPAAKRRPTVTRPARGRHRYASSRGQGARFDLEWRRRGARVFRPGMTTAELLRALQWVASRARARKQGKQQWSENDQLTTDEAKARSWAYAEVQALRYWRKPAWLAELILPSRRASQYGDFLGLLVLAYRAGAAGLVLSYEEAMSLFKIGSRSTWRKWTAEMEQLGLVTITQLWKLGEDGNPCYDRLHFRIGPALEEMGGPALLEDADEPLNSALNRWRRKIAAGLRRKAAESRRVRKGELWQACRKRKASAEGAHEQAPEGGPQASVEERPAASDAPEGEPIDEALLDLLVAWVPGQPSPLPEPEAPQKAAQEPAEAESQAQEGADVRNDDAAAVNNDVLDSQQSTQCTPLYPLTGAYHADPLRGSGKIGRQSRLTAVPSLPSDVDAPAQEPPTKILDTPTSSERRACASSDELANAPHMRSSHGPPSARGRRRRSGETSTTSTHDPVRITCPTCHGGGGLGPEPCATCEGACSIEVLPGSACPVCGGTGGGGDVCSACSGDGYVGAVRDCPWCAVDPDPECPECDGSGTGPGGTISIPDDDDWGSS